MQGHGGGPKSRTGKAASSRNAVTHGLTTSAPVVRQVESIEDWERHAEQVIASIEPEGYLETQLAIRAAGLLWRLRRVAEYEAEHISLALDQIPQDYAAAAKYAAGVSGKPIEEMTLEKARMQTGVRLIPGPDTVTHITRYETFLHRQLIQTLHEIEAMQARRRGEQTPLARLDISGPPGP